MKYQHVTVGGGGPFECMFFQKMENWKRKKTRAIHLLWSSLRGEGSEIEPSKAECICIVYRQHWGLGGTLHFPQSLSLPSFKLLYQLFCINNLKFAEKKWISLITYEFPSGTFLIWQIIKRSFLFFRSGWFENPLINVNWIDSQEKRRQAGFITFRIRTFEVLSVIEDTATSILALIAFLFRHRLKLWF